MDDNKEEVDRSDVHIVALAWSQRTNKEAGYSNVMIAWAVDAIVRKLGYTPQITTQGEVELALVEKYSIAPSHVVSRYDEYVPTKFVFQKLREDFPLPDGTDRRVIIVAKPIHLFFARGMIKWPWKFNDLVVIQDYDELMGAIGYDPHKENRFWWTKGRIRFLLYLPYAAIRGNGPDPEPLGKRLVRLKAWLLKKLPRRRRV